MNALLKKEIRLLLPAWAAGFALMLIAQASKFVLDEVTGRGVFVMAVCAAGLFLGLTPFGQELKLGTLTGLLVQTVPRRRLLATKLSLLFPAVLSIGGFGLFFNGSGEGAASPDWLLAGLLVLVTGGLWTTLLCRQVSPAFWLTLLAPLGVALTMEWLHLDLRFAPIPYCLAGLWLTCRLFLRWQEVPQTTARLLSQVNTEVPISTFSLFGSSRHPTAAMVGKEFLLHREGLLVGLILLGMHILSMAGEKLSLLSDTSNSGLVSAQEMFRHFWVLWIIAPIFIGCRALAEERRMNTLTALWCLPVSRRRQLTVKLAVTLLLGLLLGGVVPWAVEQLRPALNLSSPLLGSTKGVVVLWPLLAVSAVLSVVAFYASTLSRQMLQAFGLTLVALLLGAIAFAVFTPEALNLRLWSGPLGHIIGWPLIGLVLVWLSYRNGSQPDIGTRQWLGNLAAWAITLTTAGVATFLIYHRSWEIVTHREAAHGPAAIQGSAKITESSWGRTFVLLNDGRLWVNGVKPWTESEIPKDTRFFTGAIITPGYFLAATNWIEVASSSAMTVGLRSDGTLWNLVPGAQTNSFGPVIPRQIGTDSDWKTIAANHSTILTIRTNGSLWGWNGSPDPASTTQPEVVPARLGSESDWVQARSEMSYLRTFKADGTPFSWPFANDRKPELGLKFSEQQKPAPVMQARISIPEESLSYDGPILPQVSLKQDGSLWVNRGPATLGTNTGKLVQTLYSLNTEPVWKQVQTFGRFGEFSDIIALRKDGTLWKWDAVDLPDFFDTQKAIRPRRLGPNSDWIALSYDGTIFRQVRALAADGSLWIFPDTTIWGRTVSGSLLAPSGHPMKLANLFESAVQRQP